jgi:chromosome segregation ATPase
MCKDKSKLEEIMGRKVSELEALNAKKDKRIASLEAELKWEKEEYEDKMTKVMQASAEATVNLSGAQVKMDDLKDEVNHVRQHNEDYRILVANCYTVGNRC